jgi:predicted membrane chloride channel (bestrophin family)
MQCDHPNTPLAINQLAKLVVYMFVFTIPLFLVGTSDQLLANRIGLFLFTYSFVGVELIAEELLEGPIDNPINSFE